MKYDEEIKNLLRDIIVKQIEIRKAFEKVVQLRDLVINDETERKKIEKSEIAAKVSEEKKVASNPDLCKKCTVRITGEYSGLRSRTIPELCEICASIEEGIATI